MQHMPQGVRGRRESEGVAAVWTPLPLLVRGPVARDAVGLPAVPGASPSRLSRPASLSERNELESVEISCISTSLH